ncbi:MAG: capsular polysaccharide biosynthesis protein [Oscillospiraceae bacterium]|nr:capsular polysaccharide biosynthesis protein [Oscillospiraceae bacterium]
MIDFHCHILPGIDDGSRNVEMSLAMISAQARQGIDTIVATSHFYATQRSPERFLFRRQEAYDKLLSVLPPDSPTILLGAEVLYFPGISHMEALPKLCIEGTDILLLEMPFEPWQDYYIREVRELAHSREFTLMLAHIERYYYDQPVSVWDDFLDLGILMQSNAEFFLPFRTKRKALKLLKEGRIHLLGTDCHNTESRAPRMDEAVNVIRKHLGQTVLDEIDDLGYDLLSEAGI